MKDVFLYRIVRPIIKVFFNILFRPTYRGMNNIPVDGRVVLAGNHTSNLDCLLLIASTKRTIHFLAKDELTNGFKKVIFNNMGIIPVNRRIHDKSALAKAINILNEDKVIGIFPEGTINKTNDIIMPFKIGAVKMAHDTGSSIVCFTITGRYKLFRKSIVLEYYKSFKVGEDLEVENEKLMEKIKFELRKKKGCL